MWKKVLDESSIFAGPTCDHENNVFVSTLGGALYSLDKNKGTTNWKFLLDKPSFTSPIFNKNKTRIYIGSCGGKFYCISFEGIKVTNIKYIDSINSVYKYFVAKDLGVHSERANFQQCMHSRYICPFRLP